MGPHGGLTRSPPEPLTSSQDVQGGNPGSSRPEAPSLPCPAGARSSRRDREEAGEERSTQPPPFPHCWALGRKVTDELN